MPLLRKTGLCILLSATCWLVGCDRDEMRAHPEVIELINQNKQLWQEAALVDYTFTYAISPVDCPNVDELPPKTITVEDGVVIRAFNSYGEIDSLDKQETIDVLFDQMLERAQAKPRVFARAKNEQSSLPMFHPTLGFPLTYYVDVSSDACDSVQISIYDFQ